MTILITGASGFIGFHLCLRLIREGKSTVGFDNFNSYYDPKLKDARFKILLSEAKSLGVEFKMVKGDLENTSILENTFKEYSPNKVVNLAAQAGVRYSLTNPKAYTQSNLVGFGNIIELCHHFKVEHLVYASSSSVYGGNTKIPFSEHHGVNHPVSLYAASKRANELIAHAYSHLYGLPSTGLRFFTVYGPYGRPDMALFLFTEAILKNEPIKVFNNGEMTRDFTYIDDVIESLIRIINKPPIANDSFDKNEPDPASSWAPHKIFNIGNSRPTPLMEYIDAIENCLGTSAKKVFMPMQAGDVAVTASDTTEIEKWINFKPNTPIEVGVKKFIQWYKDFYAS
tara:strand:+ start:5801 stop:6823 length:1023 start_codon:yes stop_codon:yes gene_type:complete